MRGVSGCACTRVEESHEEGATRETPHHHYHHIARQHPARRRRSETTIASPSHSATGPSPLTCPFPNTIKMGAGRVALLREQLAQCDAARAHHLDSLVVFGNGQVSPPPLGAVSGRRWPCGGVRRACDVQFVSLRLRAGCCRASPVIVVNSIMLARLPSSHVAPRSSSHSSSHRLTVSSSRHACVSAHVFFARRGLQVLSDLLSRQRPACASP